MSLRFFKIENKVKEMIESQLATIDSIILSKYICIFGIFISILLFLYIKKNCSKGYHGDICFDRHHQNDNSLLTYLE